MNALPKLIQKDLCKQPFDQFELWFDWIKQQELKDPNAMIVATADKDSNPLTRTVLLKKYAKDSFMFFTNYNSRKGQHLVENNQVCLHFPWHVFGGQVIIRGRVKKTSREISDNYIRSRHPESQAASHVSLQSQEVDSNTREEILTAIDTFKETYQGDLPPIPQNWGGFEVTPESYEFWQDGEFRVHDRFIYQRDENGEWEPKRYWP